MFPRFSFEVASAGGGFEGALLDCSKNVWTLSFILVSILVLPDFQPHIFSFLLSMEALLMLLAVQVAFCYALTLQQRPSSGHGASWSGAQGTLLAGKWSFLQMTECKTNLWIYWYLAFSVLDTWSAFASSDLFAFQGRLALAFQSSR